MCIREGWLPLACRQSRKSLYFNVSRARMIHLGNIDTLRKCQSTSFTSMGQTREASARWAVLRSRKRLEFVSAKRAQTPLQGVCTTIERTDVGSSPTATTTAQPLKIKGCNFLSPRHHCRGVRFFQGSLRRCERLVPPFRSHGRLAQLPENRGGSGGGHEAAFGSLSPILLITGDLNKPKDSCQAQNILIARLVKTAVPSPP